LVYGADELPITLGYSWFSITIWKTWLKAGMPLAAEDACGVLRLTVPSTAATGNYDE
jgi:hypothetical protein